MSFRRLSLAFSIVLCGSLALAAAAIAAGGGLGPGNYTFTSRSADAFFGMGAKGGPPGPSWSVSVNQGFNSFQPTHPGGPRQVMRNTMVYVTEFDALGNGGFGCFVVPDSAFTVSRDLSTASLHATLTGDEVCPGYGTPVDGGGKGSVYAGGDGGSIALPLQVDVMWSAKSAVTSYKDTFTLRCLSYGADGTSSNQYVDAGASGTISVLGGPFTADFADVNSGSNQLNIHNTPPDACYA